MVLKSKLFFLNSFVCVSEALKGEKKHIEWNLINAGAAFRRHLRAHWWLRYESTLSSLNSDNSMHFYRCLYVLEILLSASKKQAVF